MAGLDSLQAIQALRSSHVVNVGVRRNQMRKTLSRERDGMRQQGVIEASEWAGWLVQREARGPGDLPNAMRRLETRYGIPSGVLKALRYKQPEDILHSVYITIRTAYLSELERQTNALCHEAELVRATIRAAENVGCPADSEMQLLRRDHRRAVAREKRQ
jgi:hypothetical protein